MKKFYFMLTILVGCLCIFLLVNTYTKNHFLFLKQDEFIYENNGELNKIDLSDFITADEIILSNAKLRIEIEGASDIENEYTLIYNSSESVIAIAGKLPVGNYKSAIEYRNDKVEFILKVLK